MAWNVQGPTPIAQRNREKLGESDKGIILFRKLLKQEVEVVAKGGDPMNTFRDPAKAECVTLPLEHVTVNQSGPPMKYIPGEHGYSTDKDKIEETMASWRS